MLTILENHELNINLIQEMSFQGGDGYQYFMNHDLSFAAIARIFEFCFDNSFQDDADVLIGVGFRY